MSQRPQSSYVQDQIAWFESMLSSHQEELEKMTKQHKRRSSMYRQLIEHKNGRIEKLEQDGIAQGKRLRQLEEMYENVQRASSADVHASIMASASTGQVAVLHGDTSSPAIARSGFAKALQRMLPPHKRVVETEVQKDTDDVKEEVTVQKGQREQRSRRINYNVERCALPKRDDVPEESSLADKLRECEKEKEAMERELKRVQELLQEEKKENEQRIKRYFEIRSAYREERGELERKVQVLICQREAEEKRMLKEIREMAVKVAAADDDRERLEQELEELKVKHSETLEDMNKAIEEAQQQTHQRDEHALCELEEELRAEAADAARALEDETEWDDDDEGEDADEALLCIPVPHDEESTDVDGVPSSASLLLPDLVAAIVREMEREEGEIEEENTGENTDNAIDNDLLRIWCKPLPYIGSHVVLQPQRELADRSVSHMYCAQEPEPSVQFDSAEDEPYSPAHADESESDGEEDDEGCWVDDGSVPTSENAPQNKPMSTGPVQPVKTPSVEEVQEAHGKRKGSRAELSECSRLLQRLEKNTEQLLRCKVQSAVYEREMTRLLQTVASNEREIRQYKQRAIEYEKKLAMYEGERAALKEREEEQLRKDIHQLRLATERKQFEIQHLRKNLKECHKRAKKSRKAEKKAEKRAKPTLLSKLLSPRGSRSRSSDERPVVLQQAIEFDQELPSAHELRKREQEQQCRDAYQQIAAAYGQRS